MKRFSENPKDRMTGRTIKSIAFTGDITDKEILNIGALGGWFEDWILEHNKYKRLVGLDLPGKYIKELQNTYKDHEKIEFIEGSVLELPFKKNSFDIISMWEVLEHLPKNQELFALMEINRVLKKDGVLVLSTPNDYWGAKLLDPAWYFGHRHYKKENLKYLLNEAGFFHYEIESYGGWWDMGVMLLFYIFKWIFRSEIPFKDFFEKKRHEEFEREGFATIFLRATKNRES